MFMRANHLLKCSKIFLSVPNYASCTSLATFRSKLLICEDKSKYTLYNSQVCHKATATTATKNEDFEEKLQRIKRFKELQDARAKVIAQGVDVPFSSAKLTELPFIYASLSKWYLTLFVTITANAGYCLTPTLFNHSSFLFLTIGTTLCSCSANTLNQIKEIEWDAVMDRTAARPLVRQLISPNHALIFAAASGSIGTMSLYYGTNSITAVLGFSNILLYAFVYTPMKRQHWFNTWVGSVVGAIPPVMGWTAATGQIDAGAFILSGVLYAWQFPHFYALAWRRKADYARGNYHMLPLSHPVSTQWVVLAHALGLWGICLAAPITGVTSWIFFGLSAPLNAWITRDSYTFFKEGNSRTAQTLYKCSLYYIILISLGIILDRKVIKPYIIDKYFNNEESIPTAST